MMFELDYYFFLVFLIISVKGGHQEPEFVEPLKNMTVPAGRDVKFACTVRHLGSYKVAWIHFERSAILTVHNNVITRNPRVGVSHDGHRTWYLHLNDVQESDRGRYLCQINTAQARTQSAYLNVVVPPSIDDAMSSSDVIVREGSDVTLHCSARGSPFPVVKWRREDGKRISYNRTSTAVEIEGPSLELHKISRLDMGSYLCIASNGVPPTVSKRIHVSVDFPPMVWVPQQLVGAPAGSSITIECWLEAYPAALHYWSRPDGQVLHDPTKYRMESVSGPIDNTNQSYAVASYGVFNSRVPPTDGDLPITALNPSSYKTHLKLTIRHLTAKDYGPYRCVAKNPRGETDGTIKVYQTHRNGHLLDTAKGIQEQSDNEVSSPNELAEELEAQKAALGNESQANHAGSKKISLRNEKQPPTMKDEWRSPAFPTSGTGKTSAVGTLGCQPFLLLLAVWFLCHW